MKRPLIAVLTALVIAVPASLAATQANADAWNLQRHFAKPAATKTNTHKPPKPTPTATTPTPTPTPTAPGGPPVARDCSVDVTAGLNAWFASVPNGSTADLAGGCYLVNGTINLPNRSNLVIEGSGATIKANVNATQFTNRAQLSLDLGSNITVRNLTLRGSNNSADCAQPGGISCYDSSREWDHNLRVTGTNGVLVDHVTFQHAWGDAIALSPGGNWDPQGVGAIMATDVTVQNSSVDTTGRMALSCTGCVRFTLANSTVINVGYHVVDAEPEATVWNASGTIRGVTYNNTYLSLLSSTTGPGTRGPFTVTDNHRTDQPVTCYGLVQVAPAEGGQPAGDVTISGNSGITYHHAFEVSGSSKVTVTNNDVDTQGCNGPGSAAGVNLANDGPTTVTGNTFHSAGQIALVSNTPNIVLCGNRLNGSAYDQPVAC